MLLDIGSVLGGIGLAVVGFVVVILVCVVILRLLASLLPSYEDRDAAARDPDQPVSVDEAATSSEPASGIDVARASEAQPGMDEKPQL
jgi:hypothetical protein